VIILETFEVDQIKCVRINRHYVVNALSKAFATILPLLDGSSYIKTPSSNDVVAAVELAPDFNTKNAPFSS